jgi:hypothetical protein
MLHRTKWARDSVGASAIREIRACVIAMQAACGWFRRSKIPSPQRRLGSHEACVTGFMHVACDARLHRHDV